MGNVIAIGALVIGFLFLIGRKAQGNAPLVLVQMPDGSFAYIPEDQQAILQQQSARQTASAAPRPGQPGYGSTIGKTAIAAGTSVGTAAIAGASVATAALTAGITAGASLLFYAIAAKGLFRGGEEGISTNPKRDAWFAQFVGFMHPGQEADISLQYESFVSFSTLAGLDGNEAKAILDRIYPADRDEELYAATRYARDVFAAHGVEIGSY